ncbi:MAG: sigma factor-like helix-turn-helix DNA-binding protein [Candidatus Limnocylindria bacterium]
MPRPAEQGFVPPPSTAERDALAAVDLLGAVGRAVDGMPGSRHPAVIIQRLGLGDAPPQTLERIGAQLGITRERVRQLELKSMPRLKRAVLADPEGEAVVLQLTSALAPGAPGYADRVVAATALLCPDWPARSGRRVVMALAGRSSAGALDDKRSLRLVREVVDEVARLDSSRSVDVRGGTSEARSVELPPGTGTTNLADDADRREREQVSLYEAVAASSGARPTGRWARFDLPGWFSVGITHVECPTCTTDMEGYRKPYVTSAGARYHYWALVCVACRRAWAPADLDDGSRSGLYQTSEHRPSIEHDREGAGR